MKLGVSQSFFDTVGRTPMVKLKRLTNDRTGDVFLKLEHLNPLGSVKDRSAYQRVGRAEAKNLLGPGGTVVEASSGNAAISLALVCRMRGYKCAIVLPGSSPSEFRMVLEALGAKVHIVPGSAGLKTAIRTAEELARTTPGAWYSGQFGDSEGWVDFTQLGEEIVAHVNANGSSPGAFVCGVGTGATLVGVAKVLRSSFPRIRIQAVSCADPEADRADFISGLAEIASAPNPAFNWLDGVTHVSRLEAAEMRRQLARTEGLLVGDSTGANVVAALRLTRSMQGQPVYSLAIDSGERYFSTETVA